MSEYGPRVLFLDLDGTVRKGKDELGRFVNSPLDVEVFPEAFERMRKWHDAGGLIAGVTNQGGVGLGYMSRSDHNAIQGETDRQCGDLFYVMDACVHSPGDGCWCRKPMTGMLHRIADGVFGDFGRYPLVSECLMVGDMESDQLTARNAGVPFQYAHHWRAGYDVDYSHSVYSAEYTISGDDR